MRGWIGDAGWHRHLGCPGLFACRKAPPPARGSCLRNGVLGVRKTWVGSSMVEQRPFKALVVGSSPTQPTSATASKTEACERETQFKRFSDSFKNRQFCPRFVPFLHISRLLFVSFFRPPARPLERALESDSPPRRLPPLTGASESPASSVAENNGCRPAERIQ